MKDKYETLNAIQFVFSIDGKRLMTAALLSYQATLSDENSVEYKNAQYLLDNVFDVWKERRVMTGVNKKA